MTHNARHQEIARQEIAAVSAQANRKADARQAIGDSLGHLAGAFGWTSRTTEAAQPEPPTPTLSPTGAIIPTAGIGQGVRQDPPPPKPTPAEQLQASIAHSIKTIRARQYY